MTPNHDTLRIIAGWVTNLVDVTAHRGDKPTRDAVAAYATILGQSLPSGAFTAQSLAHVTSAREWFPAVGVVGTLLAEWWNDHKPHTAPRLTDGRPKPAGWDELDDHWLTFWHKRLTEIRAMPDVSKHRFQGERLMSLLRQQAPRVSQFLGHGSSVEERASPERIAEMLDTMRRESARTERHVGGGAKSRLKDVSLTREQLGRSPPVEVVAHG